MLTYTKDCCQLEFVGSSYEIDMELAFQSITTSPEFLLQHEEYNRYILLYNDVIGVQELFKIKNLKQWKKY